MKIHSEEHYFIKKRIFERWLSMCTEGDQQACIDAYNLSGKMLHFLDTIKEEFIRESAKTWLIEKRRKILNVVENDVFFNMSITQ